MLIFKNCLFLFFTVIFLAFCADAAYSSEPPVDNDVLTLYAYIVKNNAGQSRKLSYHLAEVTVKTARQSGLPIALLAAVQKVESNFHVTAVSNKDARGVMQVHYPTWGKKINLTDTNKWMLFAPSVNVPVGAAILKSYLEMEGYNVAKALFRYLGLPDEKVVRISSKNQKLQQQRMNYALSIIKEYIKYKNFHEWFIQATSASS